MTKNTLLIVLIIAGLLGALLSFVHRYQAEARNRRVELMVDWPDAQALANTTHQRIDQVLAQLRDSGVTTVAIAEDTLDTLRLNYIVGVTRDGAGVLLSFAPGFEAQRTRVAQMLAHKAPGLPVRAVGADRLRIAAPWPQFSNVPIGLDDDAVTTVRRSGLRIAPRLINYTGVTPENIAWDLKQTQDQCTPAATGPLIFAGSAVLGNRGLIRATADAIRADGLTYGTVEFSKMFGDDDLSRLAADRTVRVHSIGLDEIASMDEPTAVERFVRAARERNIRVCYVRLFLSGLDKEPDVILANTDFIKEIVKKMREARLTIGPAHPYRTDPTPARGLRILMAVGVVAGGLLLLRLFIGIDGRAFWGVLTVGLLLGAALAFPSTTPKGREVLALLAACAFPTLGLCYFALPTPRCGERPTRGQVLGRAFAAYARMTLATLAGVVFVVGLLSGRLFLLKVDEFLGVKLVLVAPVLLVAAYYGLGLAEMGGDAGWGLRRARAAETVRALAGRPLLVGQVVVGLIALVALALFVARSGNDPGVGVSPTELKVRALLDHYLLVRPRTKEFLLGHPALFFALAASAACRYPKWVLPLLIVGAIGQSSLLDTFCHLHTPLFLSLLRALIGWALGAVIGVLIYLGVEAATRPAIERPLEAVR